MLKVQLLTETAIAPTVAHPGEDVAFDLYADRDMVIPPDSLGKVHTGVAIQFVPAAGAILKCRSSLASKCEASVEAGVIDAGYRGEVVVMLRNHSKTGFLKIVKGERVAQFLKVPVVYDEVLVVDELSVSARGEKGFGSTGK